MPGPSSLLAAAVLRRPRPRLRLLLSALLLLAARRLWQRLVLRPARLEARLRGRAALITGGGGGLGRLLAARLAGLGLLRRLVLWDVSEEGLAETQAAVSRADPTVEVVTRVVDVSDPQAVNDAAAAEEDAPDLLLLNAGRVIGNSFVEEKDEAAIQAVFGVNVLHLFWAARAFLPRMYEKPHFTRIVTIASAAGLSGNARLSDYCSSKFAAVGFAESMQYEMRKRNMRTTMSLVNPYMIDTGMFKGARFRCSLLPLLDPRQVVESIIENCVLGDCDNLCLPRFLYLVPLLKLLPAEVRFFISKHVIGSSDSMDSFHGRSRCQSRF